MLKLGNNPFKQYPKRADRMAVLYLTLIFVIVSQMACVLSPSAKPTAAPSSDNSSAQVDQILEHHTKAVGGRAAIDSISSYKTQGTFASSVLREPGVFKVWGKDPHKTLSVIEFPRVGTLKKGFDGKSRWVQTPVGTFTDESPREMAEVEQDAEVYRAGKIRSLYESMSVEGPGRINGREVYIVLGKPAKGSAEKLFFDKDNGLLLRWDMVRRNPKRGNVFVKVHLDDYREVDGVKVPFKIRFAFESFDITLNVDSLEHNIPIDDSLFAKPR